MFLISCINLHTFGSIVITLFELCSIKDLANIICNFLAIFSYCLLTFASFISSFDIPRLVNTSTYSPPIPSIIPSLSPSTISNGVYAILSQFLSKHPSIVAGTIFLSKPFSVWHPIISSSKSFSVFPKFGLNSNSESSPLCEFMPSNISHNPFLSLSNVPAPIVGL